MFTGYGLIELALENLIETTNSDRQWAEAHCLMAAALDILNRNYTADLISFKADRHRSPDIG